MKHTELGKALGCWLTEELDRLDTGNGYTVSSSSSHITPSHRWESRGYHDVHVTVRVYTDELYVEPETEVES